MRFLTPIQIPVFYHTDETKSLESAGVEFTLEKCEQRTVLFYSIDFVESYEENNKQYSIIGSGSKFFNSSLAYSEVATLIQRHLQKTEPGYGCKN